MSSRSCWANGLGLRLRAQLCLFQPVAFPAYYSVLWSLSSTICFQTPFSPNPLPTAADISAIDDKTLVVICGSSVLTLAAAMLPFADAKKCQRSQANEVGGGDKEVVRVCYFSGGRTRKGDG